MNTLKGVIIGCGAIAREHLTALADIGVEVAAVCDLSAARAEATAERFGVSSWYSSYEKMLADVRPDLVHITTPPAAHFSIAKACLSARLNVLCEKPITVEYGDFAQLKQLAIRNQCLLMESQNLRFHSSVQRIQGLIASGKLGDVLEVQIFLFLNILGPGSPYTDENAPHFSLVLRGGVIGDFLPHIAYLAHMFTGSAGAVRTLWKKHTANSPLRTDEFRGIVAGERATALVEFSGNAQPNGFWLRVIGTQMQAEANLFEPPRITLRRYRSGEPALMSLIDGMAEARDVFKGAVAGFWRKLGGTSSYDGLSQMLALIYRSIELREPPPVSLDDIDASARLVDSFTNPDFTL